MVKQGFNDIWTAGVFALAWNLKSIQELQCYRDVLGSWPSIHASWKPTMYFNASIAAAKTFTVACIVEVIKTVKSHMCMPLHVIKNTPW